MNTFLHITNIGQKYAISSLEDNIKGFLDWSFLNIGAYVNVEIPTSGLYGSNFHTLKPVTDPSQKAKLWEAPRKDWVYENCTSGNYSAIQISGINLNGTFLPGPTGSGTYSYTMNYPLGRISFDNNVSSSSTVTMEYSYRYVQVYKANESAWWKELQSQTYNPANFSSTGDSSITANHRIQLPAIIVETIPRTVLIPRELGTTQNVVIQDVLLHIFAENIGQRNNLTEILVMQKDNTLALYDVNKVVKEDKFPINSNGSINPSGYSYPCLTTNYRRQWCTIKDSTITELNTISSALYNGIVRWSIEIFP